MNIRKSIQSTPALILISIITLLFTATIGGTIIWLLYSHIHALFPNAANSGIIAKDLGWWNSVCIVWMFSICIKPSVKSNND